MVIDYEKGLNLMELQTISKNLGVANSSKLAFLFRNLYECFKQRDCERIEISPLVYTKDGEFRAANARI